LVKSKTFFTLRRRLQEWSSGILRDGHFTKSLFST
jgi:hypothetical protein